MSGTSWAEAFGVVVSAPAGKWAVRIIDETDVYSTPLYVWFFAAGALIVILRLFAWGAGLSGKVYSYPYIAKIQN